MKIIFMGTPDFAVAALEKIIEAGHEVLLAVTQPDKPKGRSKTLMPPPVKECAIAHGIPVFQPIRIKTEDSVAELKKYEADIFVVAAFGQILSKEILDMPRLGCVNIHASLLPRYRGAAPIQRSILDGEAKTGVTIMQMDVGLDTGDMLARSEVVIEPTDTGDTLHDKLAAAGGKLIVETLPLIQAGDIVPQVQDDSASTYARMLSKAEGLIDWNRSAAEIDRQIRAFNSWPCAYTSYNGKSLKVWEAKAVDHMEDTKAQAGTIVKVDKNSILVACGEGCIQLDRIQLEGKKAMTTHDFLLGVKVSVGEMLGSNNN